MTLSSARKRLAPLGTAVAVGLAAFQMYATGGFGMVEAPVLRAWHLGLILFLTFLWKPAFRERDNAWLVIADLLLACFAVGIAAYVLYDLDDILNRMRYVDEVTGPDLVFGSLLMVLVLEATRRLSGWPLVLVALASILYALWGHLLPPAVRHSGVSYDRFIEQMFLLTDGVYGIPLAAACTMIYAFAMFGAFLEVSRMNTVFMDLACLLTRRSKGGPAKVAIFASALFGSISGSAPANVYATGVFTIPLMKRVGYSAPFAGAVEAVASTGGQIMPPIMGAAAFIMADLTGVGYLGVIKAALLPSLLYYLALWLYIHFEAVKNNLGTLPPEEIPDKAAVVRRLYYLLPIAILIVILLSGRSVNFAAFSTTLFILVLSMLGPATRFTVRGLIRALELTARNALMVSTCCACAGIVVGVISLTGIGFKFINAITTLAGSCLPILLLLLMATCMVLGMGVPTTPAYIIVATLGAPALMKMGVPTIAAHMFVFYYAILSVITPPVCLAAFSGAAIAGANAMRTGMAAVRMGIVAFIVPFMFVFAPELLWQGSFIDVLIATVTAVVGIFGIAGAMQGWLLVRANLAERGLLMAGGLVLLYPGAITDFIGAVLMVLVVAAQYIRRRSAREESAPWNRAGAACPDPDGRA